MRHRRASREDGASPVLETTLVAAVVLASVLFATSVTTPATTQPATRAALEASSSDALLVLQELPPTDTLVHETLLEELVTAGLRGDCANLTRKLHGYYPPAVTFDVVLENGHGGRIPVCGASFGGERSATSAVLQPRWSHLFTVPNVTETDGVVKLDSDGLPVAADRMHLHGYLVRHSYVDAKTPVDVVFENGFTTPFVAKGGTRFAGPVPPEHVTAFGHVDGYAVPYDTNGSWQDYRASSTNLSQPVAPFTIGHDLPFPTPPGGGYSVHPTYASTDALSAALLSVDPRDRVQPDARDHTLGSDVTLRWNYGLVTGTLSHLAFRDGSLTVYDPLGREWNSATVTGMTGEATFHVPRDVLWGSYVAHLQLDLEERNVTGTPTGRVYAVNQMTYFDVHPPGWVSLAERIAPVYRLVLVAGFADG